MTNEWEMVKNNPFKRVFFRVSRPRSRLKNVARCTTYILDSCGRMKTSLMQKT